jgi:hypothetical protein
VPWFPSLVSNGLPAGAETAPLPIAYCNGKRGRFILNRHTNAWCKQAFPGFTVRAVTIQKQLYVSSYKITPL